MGRAPFVAMQTDLKKEDRVELISQITGFNRDEVLGKLFRLWAWCTDRGLDDAPDDCEGYAVAERVIVQYFGERGVDAILGDGCDSLAMGVRRSDGLIYLRGTHETVSRLRSVRATAKAGGRSAAGSSKRGTNGQFVRKQQFSQPTVQLETSSQPADGPAGNQQPASYKPAPSSEIPQILDLSPARAILPTTVPSTNHSTESDWNRKQRWWTAMHEADARIKASGIDPNAPSLPNGFAGENEKNMQACVRQLMDAGYNQEQVNAKMLHIVLVAEAEAMREGHRRWFKPAMIWDPKRANRAVDTTLEEVRRKREQQRPSPRPDPDPHPPRNMKPL